MDDSIHLIDRIVVVGHVSGLAAATLVNRDVDDDRTGAHLFQIRFSDNLRCLLAGDQHRADNQVGCLQRVFDVDVVGVKGLDARSEDVVQVLQAVDVDIHDGDVRAHADRNLAGVGADASAADDDDVRLRGSGHAGEQNAGSAVNLLQILGAFLHAQAARNLAHRGKQRQITVLIQRLIGHALDAGGQHRVGQRAVRRQMQVGVDDLPLAEILVLVRKRFLDLDDHLSGLPHLARRFQNGGARLDVIVGHKA